ncbi:spermatogenesis-associated serine-rich protein 2-like [Stegostoma tigrinum]|uniref:spermatogenesis-associated serine-rich protein 2-like n=1 Tax=Stegostoma tigrinum TaxID=3053191 RepID=UPI0028709466|nr:spermatogenesis-associated serine-rich protein 2-like [Stegostoma tigrinum]XP_048391327.2 spermatogenesis-associated serine-rich protein 2-like [Stegostoma tigrinum]XP_048391328.2 spermatogenesis-associated serine-rich protein 2-like [Stegostoma tigrinum]XP_059503132.1 spermatogenesis-associated serine-rich protein 2-like [Stegostoma tigrinum]
MSVTNIQEKFKEKITAVRTVVPNRSNNEIILVLQHFDNNVNKAVQAFMDGSAVEILKEWNVPGKRKHNKKRKRKPKQPSGQVKEERARPGGLEENVDLPLSKAGLNGYHANGSANDDSSVDSLSERMEIFPNDEKAVASLKLHQLQAPDKTVGLSPEEEKLPLEPTEQLLHDAKCLPNRSTTTKSKPKALPGSHSMAPQSPTTPGDLVSNKKRGTSIEKSVKDLQRCTVSLARYQLLIKEEMDASVKKVKSTFAELQACIMDREVALMSEMDKVKKEAMEILDARQRRAEELKRLTDMAIQMSETQLAELRAEIKQFVSERKYDEDLGRSARFTGNIDSLQAQIQLFGEVSHPKNNYSTRPQRTSSLSPAHLNPQGSSNNVPSGPSLLAALSSVSSKAVNSRDNSSIQKAPADRPNYQRYGPSGQRRGFNSREQGLRLNENQPPGKSDDCRNRSRKGRLHDGYKNQNQHNKSRHQVSSHDVHKPLLTDSTSNGTVLPAEVNTNSATPELASTISVVLSDRVPQYRSCPIKPETSVDTKMLSLPNRMTAVA